MSERLYGRSCILLVSDEQGEGRQFSGITQPAQSRVEFQGNEASISRPENARDVFRMGFNIELTSESYRVKHGTRNGETDPEKEKVERRKRSRIRK